MLSRASLRCYAPLTAAGFPHKDSIEAERMPWGLLLCHYEANIPVSHIALMMGMGDIILGRISFGGVKELEEIYSD
jgi:hypothetical protein